MADGYLVIFAGQSLVAENPSIPPPPEDTYNHVYMMEPGSRVFTPFSTVQDGNGDVSFNAYKKTTAATMSPVTKLAYEWEARKRLGVSMPDLFILTVAQQASSFTLESTVAGRSQWNLERKRNAQGGGWDNTLFSIPTEISPGIWEEGVTTSCVSTLQQCIAAAIADISGRGLVPKHLFTCWIHGQADSAFAQASAEYAANEQALRELVDSALGATNATWITVALSGQALSRTGSAVLSAGRSAYVAATPNTILIDPTTFAEYAASGPTYGGIHENDGLHLSELGAWRIGGDSCCALTIDCAVQAVPL